MSLQEGVKPLRAALSRDGRMSPLVMRELISSLSRDIKTWEDQHESARDKGCEKMRAYLLTQALQDIGELWRVRQLNRNATLQYPQGSTIHYPQSVYVFLLKDGNWCNEHGELEWEDGARKEMDRYVQLLSDRKGQDKRWELTGFSGWKWAVFTEPMFHPVGFEDEDRKARLDFIKTQAQACAMRARTPSVGPVKVGARL